MEGITDKSPSESGSWCVFVKINDEHGIKFYKSERERDEAKALQQRAYACDCGPSVGGNAEMDYMPTWEKPYAWQRIPEKVFGYITEVVNTDEIETWECDDLYEKLQRNGFNVRDVAPYNNAGTRKDGTIVAYDFDPVFNRELTYDQRQEYARM